MQIIRVPSDEFVAERFDNGFYAPAYFDTVGMIRRAGLATCRVGSICQPWQFGAYALCNHIEWSSADSGIPYIKAEALGSPLLNYDGLSYVTRATHDLLEKSRVKPGDVIVSTSGTIGLCAVIPKAITEANSNQDTIKFNASASGYDNYFIAAWFACRYGQVFLNREAGGGVQQHVYLYNFCRLPVLDLKDRAQKYVGDKVRQAERLGEHAKEVRSDLHAAEISLIPITKPSPATEKGWRTSGAALSENRLDSKFYRGHYLEVERLAVGTAFPLLSSIVSRFRYGASIEADYVPTGEGLLFLRGNDIDKNRIDRPHCVDIRSSWLSEIGDNLLKPGMVVITRSGTVGTAVAVSEELNGAAYGSFVISLELVEGWNPFYVAWFLNSWLGRTQTERLENGAVQLNINIQELGSVRIWKASDEVQDSIAARVNSFNLALDSAHNLTTAAKLLVEALIEGKVSEAELIAAQEALEKGDDTADRALLRRLTRHGLDVPGQPPLFPDLGVLYALIAQTKETAE